MTACSDAGLWCSAGREKAVHTVTSCGEQSTGKTDLLGFGVVVGQVGHSARHREAGLGQLDEILLNMAGNLQWVVWRGN